MVLSAKQRAKLRQLGRTVAVLEQQHAGMRRAREASRTFCREAKEKIAELNRRAASYREKGNNDLACQEEMKARDLQAQIEESNAELEAMQPLQERLMRFLSSNRSIYNSVRERARLSHSDLGVSYGNPDVELARAAGAADAPIIGTRR